MTLNLQALAPPPFICPNIKIPTFTYGTSVHARKPLQLAASAAFFLGVTLASTITASLMAPLYVVIEDLKKLTVKQMQAIHALSDGLTTLNHIVQNMHLEMLAIKKRIGKMDQHNLEMFQKMYTETLKNSHDIQCLQAEQMLDTLMNDLHILFITGNSETPTFKTIMDDRYHSECSSGICTINLLQIFLANAKTAHFSTTISRKLGDTYVTSSTQLLYINDTKAFYYP
jgi:D-ribose pyranose/furanose isomerase RbsD